MKCSQCRIQWFELSIPQVHAMCVHTKQKQPQSTFSSNESVKFIMKHCMNAGNSIIVKNLFYVCSQFDCNTTDVFNSKLYFIKTEVREKQCMTVEFVRELLNIRDGVMKISYVDEVYVTAN